jgi:hypothetical protein
VWPVGQQYQITVWYFRTVPPLSTTAPTNSLLANHPDLYLAGAMSEAEFFYKVPQPARGPWAGMFGGLIEQLNGVQRRTQVAGGTLRTMPAYGNR